MTTKRTPKFRHHKASGQGFVELAGKRIYLGRFDLPETEARYHRAGSADDAVGVGAVGGVSVIRPCRRPQFGEIQPPTGNIGHPRYRSSDCNFRFPGGRYTRARKVRRWSRRTVKWEMSGNTNARTPRLVSMTRSF